MPGVERSNPVRDVDGSLLRPALVALVAAAGLSAAVLLGRGERGTERSKPTTTVVLVAGQPAASPTRRAPAATAPSPSPAAVAAPALVTFPSRSCRFAMPAGWRVVWVDLDRGSVVHSEARPPDASGATLACDVAPDGAETAEAAARAARRQEAQAPGYRERRFTAIGSGPQARWRFDAVSSGPTGAVLVRRVFAPDGAVLVLSTPAGEPAAEDRAVEPLLSAFAGRR